MECGIGIDAGGFIRPSSNWLKPSTVRSYRSGFRMCQSNLPINVPLLMAPNCLLSTLSPCVPITKISSLSGKTWSTSFIIVPYDGCLKATISPFLMVLKKKGILATTTKSPSRYRGDRLSPETLSNLNITGRDKPFPALGHMELSLF